MKKKNRSRGYKNNRYNKMGILSIMVVMFMILAVISIQSISLSAKNAEYIKQEQELKKRIEKEEVRTEEIEELKDYVTTKKYIEEVAKEKLGLVYEDEIIFKSED